MSFNDVFAQPRCSTVALEATRRFGPVLADLAQGWFRTTRCQVSPRRRSKRTVDPPRWGRRTVTTRSVSTSPKRRRPTTSPTSCAGSGPAPPEVFPELRLDWSQMAVLVRSGRRDLPSLQRALLAAGIPTEIARDDIPLALTPAVRPLLDVLRAAAGVDGGLTAERAADLLCSPLGGLDARRLARLGRLLRRRDVGRPARILHAIGRGRSAGSRPARVIEADLARPVADLASLLEGRPPGSPANTQTSRVLGLVWRGTGWPATPAQGDARQGGRRAREANQALDAVGWSCSIRPSRWTGPSNPCGRWRSSCTNWMLRPSGGPTGQKAWNRDAVRLMTAHRAKGSQWPLVVVAGVQQGLWPDLRARQTCSTVQVNSQPQGAASREEQMLEERRLFFVACTRIPGAAGHRCQEHDRGWPGAFSFRGPGRRRQVDRGGGFR